MNTNSWYGYEIQSVTVSEPPDKVRAENLNTALNAIGDGLAIETSLLIYTDNIYPILIIKLAACDHPPGLEPKSNNNEFFFIKPNLLFISINLYADLDL